MIDTSLQVQISLRMMYLRRVGTVVLNAQLAPLNASSAMYSVLLRLANETQPVPQAELASDAALDPAGVSRMIARMAKDGLVRVAPDPADRRARLISLTPKGSKLERALSPVVHDVMNRHFDGLDDDELRQLLALLMKIRVANEGEPEPRDAQ